MSVLLLALLAAVGPRPTVDTPPGVTPIDRRLPRELRQLATYVDSAERAVAGVVPEAAARITFAGDTARTPYAVVYLHGFSATREETAPLSARIAAALGANLFEARLTGHGMPGEALGEATAGDWLEDALEALVIGRRIGDSVVVVATSTGGTLALWHALADARASSAPGGPDRLPLRALVLLSPNLGPRDPAARFLTLPWMRVLLPLVMPERTWTPANPEQARAWTVSYPTVALLPMQALVEELRERDPARLATPTLALLNPDDPVIDAERAEAFLRRAPADRVRVAALTPPAGNDGHVLAGRIVAPDGTAIVLERALRFLGVPRPDPAAGAARAASPDAPPDTTPRPRP